ncbi:MAG: glutathione S-transferase N-terminal domain-containing protein [Pseudomonadota bacterium]
MVAASKRSVITLYSDINDPYSHQVRMVLAEKGVSYDLIQVNPSNKPEDLLDLNPYGNLPTLVDRDLVLYEPRIMVEYLDERFPYPPLMPVYPIARAESRKQMDYIDKHWYSKLDSFLRNRDDGLQKEFVDFLNSIAPVFKSYTYFMSDEYMLVDIVLAAFLWRTEHLLPKVNKYVKEYAKRIFARESFQKSLTEIEKQAKDAA